MGTNVFLQSFASSLLHIPKNAEQTVRKKKPPSITLWQHANCKEAATTPKQIIPSFLRQWYEDFLAENSATYSAFSCCLWYKNTLQCFFQSHSVTTYLPLWHHWPVCLHPSVLTPVQQTIRVNQFVLFVSLSHSNCLFVHFITASAFLSDYLCFLHPVYPFASWKCGFFSWEPSCCSGVWIPFKPGGRVLWSHELLTPKCLRSTTELQ